MKLRIQDSSIRFRLTLQEVEALGRDGRLERACRLPGSPPLTYALRRDPHAAESHVVLGPYRIELVLSEGDHAELASPEREGVYVQREWAGEAGTTERFMAFVEKDRPGSTCVKKEAWIYEGHHGREPKVVPIPRAAS